MSQPAAPPGIVVDCMVFVQAAANENGPAARILDLLDEGKITLYVSKLILAEARYVLNRPDVRARLHKLTDVAVEALFGRLTQRSTLIRKVPKRFVYPRDPKDEPYINLAVAMKADYLLSRDNEARFCLVPDPPICHHTRRLPTNWTEFSDHCDWRSYKPTLLCHFVSPLDARLKKKDAGAAVLLTQKCPLRHLQCAC